MTPDGMRRCNENYGDSPVRRSSLPIASSRLASSTRGTASRLPFGSTVASWPPQPSECPRPSPPLCRALMMQAAASRTSQRAERAIKHSAMREQRRDRALILGVAGKELVQHLAKRCPRIQLGEDS
jgi:hypothetical protein